MKKFLKAICDGVLALAGYAVFAATMSVVIIITPIVCVATALKEGISMTEAFESYARGLSVGFYEAFKK